MREVRLNIRTSEAEKGAYRAAAEAVGLDVATWVRQVLAAAAGLPSGQGCRRG